MGRNIGLSSPPAEILNPPAINRIHVRKGGNSQSQPQPPQPPQPEPSQPTKNPFTHLINDTNHYIQTAYTVLEIFLNKCLGRKTVWFVYILIFTYWNVVVHTFLHYMVNI